MHSRLRVLVAGFALPLAVGTVASCSAPAPAPEPETSTSAAQTTVSASAADSTVARTAASVAKEASSVSKVADMYGSLAPEKFFTMFEDCAPNGIPDSSACTGPEVGQFQFFKGDAKAASTTQLLTELRSSRVVEDTGDRVVGWSTLGTTAVITVVDNKKGLTMQQMVSSDKQDPMERIFELGLANRPTTATATATANRPATATVTATSSEPPRV